MVRIIHIGKLKLGNFIADHKYYYGLVDGLMQLPVPESIRIGKKIFNVPKTMTELADTICYGQRLYMPREEKNDVDLILRIICGYYFSLVTQKKWDEDSLFEIKEIVINCTVKELYPTAMHFVELISQLIDQEVKLLHRDLSKIEIAAGIDMLNPFSELNALDFLRDCMKVTVPEVLLSPYQECLVRFMNNKAHSDYQLRYAQLAQETYEAKNKFVNKR